MNVIKNNNNNTNVMRKNNMNVMRKNNNNLFL